MKNIKINHEFTLKEILQVIKKCGHYNGSLNQSRDNMLNKINEYLRMIE